MSEANDTGNTNDTDSGSTTNTTSENQTAVLNTNNITIERGGNTGRKGYRKRKGIEKMIIVGARVSAKCGELIPNARGTKYRRVRERLYRKVISSVSSNKYGILLDNGTEKELQSNALRIEDSSAGIPISEASEEPAEVEDNVNEANIDNDMDQEETEDVIFPMDGADNDLVFEETYEEDDSMNDEAEINIGNINIPADPDGTSNENTNNTDSNTSQSYHQKLEAKRKMIKELIGNVVTKTQKNLTMNWKVVEESVPERNPEIADIRDTLQSKIGFKNLLEFMYKFRYK